MKIRDVVGEYPVGPGVNVSVEIDRHGRRTYHVNGSVALVAIREDEYSSRWHVEHPGYVPELLDEDALTLLAILDDPVEGTHSNWFPHRTLQSAHNAILEAIREHYGGR